MKTSMRLQSGILGSLLALALSPLAHAALGGAASTLQADRMQLKAAAPTSTSKLNYTVHEMTLPNGTAVREYVADEKVFAVAWRGRQMPDLQQLMGTYFDTYTKEAKAHHGSHHHMAITHADFVMHAAGQSRLFVGSAYVPAMLPAGVKAADIQ